MRPPFAVEHRVQGSRSELSPYPPRDPGLRGVRVLVVEDDAHLREVLAYCLEIEGAEVFSAATGKSGFERFVHVRPQVIVSDVWMPDGGGYDLIARIRGLAPESGGLTPGIAFSAADDDGRALLAGFQVFFSKPLDLFTLVRAIADLARAPRG